MYEILYCLPTFVLCPILTIIFELLYFKIQKLIDKKDIINIALINLITNVTLNIILTFVAIKFSGLFLIFIILAFELYIPIIEYKMFKFAADINKDYLFHFYLANIISFVLGIILAFLGVIDVISILLYQLTL